MVIFERSSDATVTALPRQAESFGRTAADAGFDALGGDVFQWGHLDGGDGGAFVKDGNGWKQVEPAVGAAGEAEFARNQLTWAVNLRSALHQYRTRRGNQMELLVNMGNAWMWEEHKPVFDGWANAEFSAIDRSTVVGGVPHTDMSLELPKEGTLLHLMAQGLGGIVDETGFNNWGDHFVTGASWVRVVQFVLLWQRMGNAYHIINEV